MSTPAKLLRYRGNVDRTLAPQAGTPSPLRQLAEKDCNLNVLDGESIIDDAFTVFLIGSGVLHLGRRRPDPGHVAFAVQVRECGPQQTHLSRGMGEVDAARTTNRICTRDYEFA